MTIHPSRVLHKKLGEQDVCCRACGQQKQALEARAAEDKKQSRVEAVASLKESEEQRRIAKRESKAAKRAERDGSRGRKVEDPSLIYIDHPTDTPIVRSARQFFDEMGLRNFKVFVGNKINWRTVSKLAVRSLERDVNQFKRCSRYYTPPAIGLFRPGTHEIVDHTALSPAHHLSINASIATISEACCNCMLFGYIEGTGPIDTDSDVCGGILKYLMFSVARSSGKVQLSVIWNTDAPMASINLSPQNSDNLRPTDHLLIKFTEEILKLDKQKGKPKGVDCSFHSIWVNFNPADRYTNTITGRGGRETWRLLYGEEDLVEIVNTDMASGCGFVTRLHLPPMVFRQANLDQFTFIIQRVREWLTGDCSRPLEPAKKKTKVHDNSYASVSDNARLYCMELYGGVGTIGLNCIDLVKKLRCSDENPYNRECFEKSIAEMPDRYASRASYCSAGASDAVGELFSDQKHGYNVCIVDPPRKGLDNAVLHALLRKASDVGSRRYLKKLIYVSCGFKAFTRDASILTGRSCCQSAGLPSFSEPQYRWQLKHAEGHVLFPGSDHIEIFAVFERE